MLLGLSGGADSMALFHLLLEYSYPIEVAHIDHGWRKESAGEAEYLAALCQRAGVMFHLKKLSERPEANLEEKAREARLAFFKEVIETAHLHGVFLAHHADDQAETVLKRVLEGASLPKLKGLVPQAKIDGIAILRPFLGVDKKTIVKWLEKRKIDYFNDSTNHDPRFLRSRLRDEMIPALAASFGKEVSSNLCRLGEAAAELGEFLEALVAPYRETEQTLDFNKIDSAPPFLWKFLIRDFCARSHIHLNHAILDSILFHLKEGSCHKVFTAGDYRLEAHQKKLSILNK